MRLVKHLTEAKAMYEGDLWQFNELIKKDCKKYLKFLKMAGADFPLLRGMKAEGDTGVATTRPERSSSYFGEGAAIPKKFNKWLQDNGHARRDKNVVIGTTDWDNALGFAMGNHVYMIFPKDMKKYSWIDSIDVHFSYSKTGWKGGSAIASKFASEDNIKYFLDTGELKDNEKKGTALHERMKKPFEKYFHTNKGFDIAVGEGYEMWIQCKQYYYARASLFKWDKRAGQLYKDPNA